MEIILNLLVLSESQRQAFRDAAANEEQVFAPEGILSDTGKPLPVPCYDQATVILGNPPAEYLKGNRVLRFMQTRSAGVDRYLGPGILPPGAKLAGCSGAWGTSVSEHVFSMMLALMKRLPAYRDQQCRSVWAGLGTEKTVRDAQVLCVGTGDLGSSFAVLCKGMGAHTVGIRRDPSKPAEGVDEMYGPDALDDQLPLADVTALMLPRNAGTEKLITRERLLRMKPDAILLNGGRGSAVDCGALAQVLEAGHLWGAGLDVTDPEPLPPGHPLWKQPRVLITPHTGGGMRQDIWDRAAGIALENLRRYLAGEPLRNRFF